jgi:RNA polymerase sigma factor (sigma-70 family)
MSPGELAASVWRVERSRLLGAAARLLHDLDEAEDCAQDALVQALDTWPRDGAPTNPAAWLMTTTRHRALDRLRRRAMLAREHDALAADELAAGAHLVPDLAEQIDAARDEAEVGDGLLRLIFIACHPSLAREAQVALTLRLLGGLSTTEIAQAFLVPEATVAQRIVRAKRALHGQAFALPPAAEREALLALQPSPVVALNRAVAVGQAQGPHAAWVLLEALAGEPALQRYPWLAGAQADVLERLGRLPEARAAYLRAAELSDNAAQQALLRERARRIRLNDGDA